VDFWREQRSCADTSFQIYPRHPHHMVVSFPNSFLRSQRRIFWRVEVEWLSSPLCHTARPSPRIPPGAASRRDKWSGHIALPGGRQEAGETELQAAVRECREEVGVSLAPRYVCIDPRLLPIGNNSFNRCRPAYLLSCASMATSDFMSVSLS